MLNLILLLLPVFTAANIQIEITAAKNQQDQNINLVGKQIDFISDTEVMTFGLDDDNLKNAVEAYYGKRPDEIFLKSPSVGDELYINNYNWKPVTRTIKPISAKILEVKSEPVIVWTQNFENNSTEPTSVSVGMSQNVQNSVSLSWTTGGMFTVGSGINYEVNFDAANVDGTMSFSDSWGRNSENSKNIPIGSGIEVMLQPGERVIAELHSTRVTMPVEVSYEAYLSGDMAVKYSDEFKGYNLWLLDVRGVMHAGNINNSIRSTEIIEVAFYTESKVEVRENNNGVAF